MNERALRQLLRDLLRALDLHPPLDADLLCAQLGEHRGRPLELVAASLPAGAFGALIPLRRKDLVLHQENLSTPHRDLVVFHELVHLVRRHVDNRAATGVICGLDQAGNLYYRREEWEAETGAAILAAWTGEQPIGAGPTDPRERSIVRALGGREWM